MNLPTQSDKFTFLEKFMFDHGYEHTVTESEFLNLNTYLYSYRDLETLIAAALENGPFKRAEEAKESINLKLSPLTFEDLAEAAKSIVPTGKEQDVEVRDINYFQNRQLPPVAHNQMMNYYPIFPEQRPQPHGLAEWLIGLLVGGIIVFIVILFYKMRRSLIVMQLLKM